MLDRTIQKLDTIREQFNYLYLFEYLRALPGVNRSIVKSWFYRRIIRREEVIK